MIKKILIVDDEYCISELIVKTIQISSDYKAISVSNGLEAITKIVGDETFALIIIDLKMPKMNGVDTIKAIKMIKKDIPIIAITGYSSNEERTASIEAGAAEIILKPFSPKLLLKKINFYLQND